MTQEHYQDLAELEADAQARNLRRPYCRWDCYLNHSHKLTAEDLRQRFGLCRDLDACQHFVKCT